MQKSIVDALKPGDAFIGHNDEIIDKNFPPLMHEDSKGVERIAKEGVNTADYDGKDLPEDLVQYTGQNGDMLTKREGYEETNNLIKVDALIDLYNGNYSKK